MARLAVARKELALFTWDPKLTHEIWTVADGRIHLAVQQQRGGY
jgi:hypothetical protein